jgi:hypothetical protein
MALIALNKHQLALVNSIDNNQCQLAPIDPDWPDSPTLALIGPARQWLAFSSTLFPNQLTPIGPKYID